MMKKNSEKQFNKIKASSRLVRREACALLKLQTPREEEA